MKYVTIKYNFAVEICGDYPETTLLDFDILVHNLKTRLTHALMDVKMPSYLDSEVDATTEYSSLD